MDVDDIKPWVELFGTPTGIAAVLAFSVWRMSKWVTPKADKIFDRHIQFIDSVQKCNEDNTEVVKEMRNAQKSIERSQKNIEANIGEQSQVFKSMTEAMQSMANK